MATLTLFTAPKPFTNSHINVIQRNAIRSWMELGSDVQVILIGEEDGLAEVAREYGLLYLPQVERNTSGTPLVSSIFGLARQHSDAPLLACLNTDIIALPDFLSSICATADQASHFLMVGQRWDLEITQLLDFSNGWQGRLQTDLTVHGKLHPPAGSDYFVYPRTCFEQVPAFAIGRAGWDNWMIYEARRQGWKVVDATADVHIIHQNHDYSHLPGGQPHYRLPETGENVRLAGGKRTIFHLEDADTLLKDQRLQKTPLSWKKLWREVETWPLLTLHSYTLAQVFFACLHPRKAFIEFRPRLAAIKRRLLRG
jgi:hypothetical protein